MTHQCHENNHQQILLVSTSINLQRTVWRIWTLMLGVKGWRMRARSRNKFNLKSSSQTCREALCYIHEYTMNKRIFNFSFIKHFLQNKLSKRNVFKRINRNIKSSCCAWKSQFKIKILKNFPPSIRDLTFRLLNQLEVLVKRQNYHQARIFRICIFNLFKCWKINLNSIWAQTIQYKCIIS